MKKVGLPTGVDVQEISMLMKVEDLQTAAESGLPLCECGQRPRQAHCLLCVICETFMLLMKDHRDPNTL